MNVKSESRRVSASDYVNSLAASGRQFFSSQEMRTALGVSAAAVRLALHRLAKKKFIASPARGSYVIVAPEYRSVGCLPADQFIPALMKKRNSAYYTGLLSAAQYHGAAHQRPQQFQVFLAVNRRPIQCGEVRVVFFARKHLKHVAVMSFNTPRGTVLVSTPEATAIDLVGYAHKIGGLNHTATILSELVERINPKKLAAAAATAPISWAQRLGYMLDQLGHSSITGPLKEYVRMQAKQSALLVPKAMRGRAKRNKDWKLFVNAKVKSEL